MRQESELTEQIEARTRAEADVIEEVQARLEQERELAGRALCQDEKPKSAWPKRCAKSWKLNDRPRPNSNSARVAEQRLRK